MPRKGNVTRPRIEPMLMIRPSRFSRMEGSTARVTRRSPMTFVSKMTFACSAVKASVTPADMMPALLISTSILPASASTFLTPASTDASSLTSNSTVLMPSFRRASAASRFLPCARRIEAYTVWPKRNRVSAVSRPKPLLAPVIRIVLDILGLLAGSFDTAFRSANSGASSAGGTGFFDHPRDFSRVRQHHRMARGEDGRRRLDLLGHALFLVWGDHRSQLSRVLITRAGARTFGVGYTAVCARSQAV